MRFAEPCAGDGYLVSDLELAGHVSVWQSDIDPKYRWSNTKDAMTLTSQELNDADLIITNPPWSRNVLHSMIQHFASLRPTWLLFDSDWAFTLQSAELMQTLCTDIVAVGRLCWIPDTKISGKDNTSWYKFDTNKNRETIFHGR